MKLNIIAILFLTMLLTVGYTTKSNAQYRGWHRSAYWAPERMPDSFYRSCWYGRCGMGCRPWGGGSYRRMCWAGRSCPAMAEWYKDDSAFYAKRREEMESRWDNYWKDNEAHEKEMHDNWEKYHKEYWDKGYHGYWGHRWSHERYYYQGGGR